MPPRSRLHAASRKKTFQKHLSKTPYRNRGQGESKTTPPRSYKPKLKEASKPPFETTFQKKSQNESREGGYVRPSPHWSALEEIM